LLNRLERDSAVRELSIMRGGGRGGDEGKKEGEEEVEEAHLDVVSVEKAHPAVEEAHSPVVTDGAASSAAVPAPQEEGNGVDTATEVKGTPDESRAEGDSAAAGDCDLEGRVTSLEVQLEGERERVRVLEDELANAAKIIAAVEVKGTPKSGEGGGGGVESVGTGNGKGGAGDGEDGAPGQSGGYGPTSQQQETAAPTSNSSGPITSCKVYGPCSVESTGGNCATTLVAAATKDHKISMSQAAAVKRTPSRLRAQVVSPRHTNTRP
jgi:hypothetical protein